MDQSRPVFGRVSEILAPLAAALLIGGCAIKGYELGWRDDDLLAPVLGEPLDAVSGCRIGGDRVDGGGACGALGTEIDALLVASGGDPATLGARCADRRCAYANRFERRDAGFATLLPVWRRTVLREVRISFLRGADGRWSIDTLSVTDPPPPAYGPVRIGG